MKRQGDRFSRRDFVSTIAFAGVASSLGLWPPPALAESPPETQRIRLYEFPSFCPAPRYVAEDLLRIEGFTDITYVASQEGVSVYDRVGAGDVDIVHWFAAPFVMEVDRGAPIVFLGGIAVDRPWSQFFCCLAAGNQEFVRQYPIAAKRALRAMMRADEICALEPELVARAMVERGFINSYDYALQTLQNLPYGRSYDYDPDDTVRFHAVRLYDAGIIKNTPDSIIERGTDFRFLDELKRELST